MDMEKSSRINRRGFLKTVAAAGAVGLGARGAAASQKRTLVYKPGVYTAKAAGISSDVTVTATFGRDRIMDVVIDVAGETKGIGADIGGLMAKRMLEAQDCSVDGVSGATVTSNAVRTAFADCMSQASGTTVTVKVDVDGAKKDDVDLDKVVPATVVKTDAVVLGCGAAGIQAALVLQAAGVKTHLLEKGSSCGVSNGSQAGGPALAETRVQAAEGATVSIKTLFECQYGFSRGTVDAALLRKCISQGERVVSAFMDNGVNMGLRRDAYGMGFRARHNFANKEGKQLRGVDRFGPLIAKFESMGGVFETQRKAVRLLKTGEAVTGVLVRNGGDSKLIDIDSIYFIKVERKDAYIHYDSGGEEKVFVCKRSLDSLEKELTPFHFFRTHRSYLTNLSMIDYLNTDGIYIKNREESIPIRAKSLNKISRKLRELARQRNAL